MKVRYALLLPLVVLACDDDPTSPGGGYATEELTTQLAIAPHHFHTWETEGTFTVSVTDPDGQPVTDFELIRVEHRRNGVQSWTAIPLEQDGEFYVGTHTFESSGTYDLRVMGIRPSDGSIKQLYEAPQPLEVVRIHRTVGPYTLEFETFPGHIHAGESATITFWISDATAHAQEGTAFTVTGLEPTIFVTTGGETVTMQAAEGEPGVYSATHQFQAVGAHEVGVRFLGEDQQEYEWSVPITVHQPH